MSLCTKHLNDARYNRTTATKTLTIQGRLDLALDIKDKLLASWPSIRNGKHLVCLSNKHFKGKLFFDELPPTTSVPWRYELDYPNWKYIYGEKYHDPEYEPLVPNDDLFEMWAESGIYPGE